MRQVTTKVTTPTPTPIIDFANQTTDIIETPNAVKSIFNYIQSNNHFLALKSALNLLIQYKKNLVANPTKLASILNNKNLMTAWKRDNSYALLFASAMECGVSRLAINSILSIGSRAYIKDNTGDFTDNMIHPCMRIHNKDKNIKEELENLPSYQFIRSEIKQMYINIARRFNISKGNNASIDNFGGYKLNGVVYNVCTLSLSVNGFLVTVLASIKDGQWDFNNSFRIQANETKIVMSAFGIVDSNIIEAMNLIAIIPFSKPPTQEIPVPKKTISRKVDKTVNPVKKYVPKKVKKS